MSESRIETGVPSGSGRGASALASPGRDRQFGDRAAGVAVHQTKPIVVAVHDRQPVAHVGEANPVSRRSMPPATSPTPLSETRTISAPCSIVAEMSIVPGRAASAQSVANRVLDERLQNESRQQAIDGGIVDVVVDRQPVGESNPLNVEIRLDADDLFAERDFVALARRAPFGRSR